MTEVHIHIHNSAGAEPPTVTASKKASRKAATKAAPTPAKKRKGKPNPKLKKGLKAANKKARKKDGSFKKGWNKSRVMKEGHRLAKGGR